MTKFVVLNISQNHKKRNNHCIDENKALYAATEDDRLALIMISCSSMTA